MLYFEILYSQIYLRGDQGQVYFLHKTVDDVAITFGANPFIKKIPGLNETLNEFVLEKKKPILGICVGMQILSSYGNEGDQSEGLNIIEGLVEKIPTKESQLPNIG